MRWPDRIIAACGVGFLFSLIPTLIAESPNVPLTTSLTTGVLLIITATMYAILRLPWATVSASLTAGVWLMIAAGV